MISNRNVNSQPLFYQADTLSTRGRRNGGWGKLKGVKVSVSHSTFYVLSWLQASSFAETKLCPTDLVVGEDQGIMQTVICKLNSWMMAHFSLNCDIHLMPPEYTCFTEKSYANQTKFTMLLFLYKKVNRLKIEISLQFGHTYSQFQVVFCQPCWSDQFHHVRHHHGFLIQQSRVWSWTCDFSSYFIC